MSEWQTVAIGEICDLVTSGGTPLTSQKEYYHNGSIPWVKTKEVNQCRLYGTENHITQLGLDNSSAKLIPENSIIIAMYGDGKTAGRVALNKVPVTTNQACCNLILNKQKANYDFVFYNLMGRYDELVSKKTGSGQQNLNGKIIKEIEIDLPSLPEQKAIASVLSSLDDKIDLLHRQNKTLEAMAETLFRQWFIEEAKEDWEETPFTKWVYETKGGDWGKETPVDEFTQLVQCIRGTDIADLQNGLPKSTPLRYIKEKKFQSIKPEEGDIVFEISGGTETQSTGRCYFINEEIEQLFEHPLVFSNFCRLLKVRNPKYSYFVYLYLLYLYKADEFFALENGSSGIKNLNYKALLTELTYKMPPDDLVLKFHSKVSTYFSKVTKNKVQVQTLEKLRDTLLPKLMSGEVRVQYQTEEVA
ncbi:restriction endonuclease subunit S [Acinetobacter baumannii]|uniref:restriction endonuclease subunit S n=1 Tax=Acinetobacter baumannii TaxID=470 RepID=UPI002AD663C3|nr:restriction endonuclease subunit S [Acinetobacter baumannii]